LFNLSIENNDSELIVNSQLELGDAEFQATGILERVPGQSNSFFSIAPTAMINLSDLALTKTVQPGSRVDYLYFFSISSHSDSSQMLEQYQQWLKPRLLAGQSLRSGVEDIKAVNSNLKKAGNFLSLAAVLTVFLAAIAIAVNSYRYAQKQYKNNAIMLCLGCSEKRIILIELYKLITLGMIGSLVGIVLGYFVYLGILSAIESVVAIDSENNLKNLLMPAWTALVCGLFLLLSIATVNLLQLKKISPVGLIRKSSVYEKQFEKMNSTLPYWMSFTGLFIISFWTIDNIKLTVLFYLVLSLSILILYFVAKFLLAGVIHFGRAYQWINRLTLLNLQRHERSVLLQITTFSLIFALLIIIFLVRTELLSNWQQQFPDETPNHFVINVQSNEKKDFNQFLQQQSIKTQGLYPMVRGRLTHLNNRPVKQNIPETARDHNALKRELNLSFADIFAQEKEINQISIENSLAKVLDIQLDDRLIFQVGSQQIEGIVAQIRSVKWDSFQPNFYIIFSSGVIEQYPMTWIASFYLSENEQEKLNLLMEKFPGVTIIDVDEILKEVKFIIDNISHAIELIFFLIMGAGLLILSSSLLSTMASRMYENAVIRTLGASTRQLRVVLLIELLVVALISALIAVLLAEFLTYMLYQQIFQMDYSMHPSIWLGMIVMSVTFICGSGLLVVNKIFTQSTHISLSQYSD